MSGTRNTVQRALVLDAVRRLACHATADEVWQLIARDHPSVSKATVYRNINLLAEAGEIRRVEAVEGPDRFDHLCNEHYHIRCTRCERIFDVEMDYIPDLARLVRDPHGFRIEGHAILFRGLCPDCAAKTEA